MGREQKRKEQRRITAQSFVNLEDRLAFASRLVGAVGDLDKARGVFTFFCYFVAFNILYEFHKTGDDPHHEMVKNFLEKEYSDCDEFIHPAADERIKLLKGPVGNGRRTAEAGREKDWIVKETNSDIKVFLRILQIRNNLFHGNKELNDDRDMPLIKEANIVLGEFLREYFNRRSSSVEDVSSIGEEQ